MNIRIMIPTINLRLIVMTLLLFPTLFAFAQQKITGKIVENGNGLPGVVVKVKGGNLVTQTEADGTFNISADLGDILTVSYIGYQSREISVNGQQLQNIELEVDNTSLEEVTVVGYGTQKTKDLTGSVANLKADAFKDQPVINPASALQGRVSGVAVTQNSGAPGGEAKIRIRGSNSINGSNEPLYVVDGIALSSFGLQSLNVNDIESMDVLKDASATAIYGSRGANGVILITTKSGKVSKPTVSYDGFVTFNSSPKKYDLMDAPTYARMANVYAGTTVFDDPDSYVGKTTDWQDRLFQQSHTQSHQVAVSGGSEKATYYVSGFYTDQNGTLVNTNQNKYGFRSNTDIKITDRISVGVNLFGQRMNSHNNNVLTSKDNPVMASVIWAPTESVFEEGSETNYNRTGISPIWVNPYMTAMETDNNTFNNIATANGNFKYKITDWLTFTSNFGLDLNLAKTASLSNNWLTPGNMKSSQGYAETYAFQNSNVLSFDKTFNGKHNVTITAVEESTTNTSTNFAANGSGLTSTANGYYNLGLNTAQAISSGYSRWALLSFMGRATYNYDRKYLATVSFRRDGSSKFQEDNRWSNFPSFSLGWNLAEEDFIKSLGTFSSLKLRGGWGMTGNQAIGPYATLGLLNPINYAYGTTGSLQGYTTGTPTLNDLHWETTTQTDFGIDIGILNNRLTITADYYNKDTKDLLLATQIDKYLGGGTMMKNIGQVNNRGFEFAIDGKIIDNDNFQWNAVFNAAYNKNKVVRLDEDGEMLRMQRMGGGLISNDMQVVAEGYSLGAFYLIPYEGIYQADDAVLNKKAGDPKYTDTDGNNSIGYEDMVIVGSATPKVQWGFTNNLSYKNFDLNMFWQGAYGHQIFNATYAAASIVSSDVLYPTLAEVTDYWTPDNTGAKWASPNSDAKQYIESTQFLQNAGFARLKNISLTYRLPKDLLKVGAASITFSGQNLFTITKYKGLDPEASSTSASSDTNAGIDLGAYPSPKSYTVRLNLTF